MRFPTCEMRMDVMKYFIYESLNQMRKKFAKRYFDDRFYSWEEALNSSNGFDNINILNQVIDATKKVISGEALYERDGLVFKVQEINWPLLTAIYLARNFCKDTKLNILDFGGSLGSSFFQHKRYLNDIGIFNWSIVEQDHYCFAANQNIVDENLRFYSSLDSYLTEKTPSLVYFGSSLQYIDNFESVLNTINNIEADVLLIDRTPTVNFDYNLVAVQKVPKRIYRASYPVHLFNLNYLLEKIKEHWKVINVFESLGDDTYTKKGRTVKWSGILSVRKESLI